MANNDFEFIAKEQFSFLQSEFKFQLINCIVETWGYELIYKNETTGVKITYEFQAAYIFITIYRLINGKFCEDPRNINEDTVLNSFGLDDIISVQNPKALVKPAYEFGEASEYYDKEKGLMLYTLAFAKNLKLFGKKVLCGDFSIFSETEKIVKERIRTYR